MQARAKTATDPYANPKYRWYVLVVMVLVYACNSMDRALPGILIEPIRNEFQLSDAHMGLIAGTAFGLAQCLAVIPMGMLSDRVSRTRLLAVTVILWSALTAAGGLAKNGFHLILARIGVGAAEASTVPIGLPMIADIFPKKERPLAAGLFYSHAYLGTLVASIAGAYVAAEYGWREAFFVIGLPGVLLGLLLLLTVKEPKRGSVDSPQAEGPKPGLPDALRHILRNPAIACLMLASGVLSMATVSMTTWTASFFIRVHDIPLAQVGLIMAVGIGVPGIIAPAWLGWASGLLAPRHPAWPLWLTAICIGASAVTGVLQMFVPTAMMALALFVATSLLKNGFAANTQLEITGATPANMRGVILACTQVVSMLCGYGLGPLLTGLLSDFYGGGTAIRYALVWVMIIMAAAVPLYVIAAHLLYGGKTAKA